MSCTILSKRKEKIHCFCWIHASFTSSPVIWRVITEFESEVNVWVLDRTSERLGRAEDNYANDKIARTRNCRKIQNLAISYLNIDCAVRC